MAKSLAEALREAGLVSEQQYAEHTAKQQEKDSPAIELFRESSVDNPTFARITIMDEDRDVYSNNYGKAFPVWEGIVACEGTKIEEREFNRWQTEKVEGATFRSLEIGEHLGHMASDRRITPPHALRLEGSEYYVNEVLPTTPELTQQHKDVRDMMSMTIYSHVYPEFDAPPMVIQNLPYETLHTLGMNAREAMNNPLASYEHRVKGLDTEKDAMKWLIQNHPEQAISFHYQTTTGNFNLRPTIEHLSDKSYLGTRKDREAYVREQAKALGVEVGKFDYREADKARAAILNAGKTELPMNLVRTSSPDKPVFAEVNIIDDNYGVPTPVWQGMVAFEGTKTIPQRDAMGRNYDNEFVKVRAIDDGKNLNGFQMDYSMLRLQKGDAIDLKPSEMFQVKMKLVTPDLMKAYEAAKNHAEKTVPLWKPQEATKDHSHKKDFGYER